MSDLISREDAREAIEKLMDIHFDRQVVLAKARDAIVSLPSADRPKGEWINTTSGEHYKCSVCGCMASYWFDAENSIEYYNYLDMSEWLSDFCPSCGADMRGENHDRDRI